MQEFLVLTFWTLIVAADIKYRRIPKALNFLLIFLLLPLGWKFCLAAGLFWIGYLIIFRISAGAIGYGDVRLAPATAHFLIGGGLGWSAIFLPHCLAWCLGGAHALLSNRHQGKTLPFAPYLLIAGLIYQAGILVSLR